MVSVSDVPPQGAYLAKACPQAVQLDVLRPCEPLPRSPFMAMLGNEGWDFETQVVELLVAAVPDAVVIDRDLPSSGREHRPSGHWTAAFHWSSGAVSPSTRRRTASASPTSSSARTRSIRARRHLGTSRWR